MRKRIAVLLAGAALSLVAALSVLVVATEPAEAAFAGRNGKIAFMSDRSSGPGVDNPDGDFEIFTIKLDGTDLEQLTTTAATGATNNLNPVWSPDGAKIAFESNRTDPSNPGNFEIYTMNANGSNPIRLTANTVDDTAPAYAPDGKQIVFHSDRDGNGEIYRMRADGSLQTLLSNNHLARDTNPDWQPLKKRR